MGKCAVRVLVKLHVCQGKMPYVKHCPTKHVDIQYLQEAVIPVQECQSISEPCGHTSVDEVCVQPLRFNVEHNFSDLLLG